MDQDISYRLYSRQGAYGQLQDYFLWKVSAVDLGMEIGQGRPFEIRVTVLPGSLSPFTGQVDEWSTLRMDLFVFMEETDRQNFLIAERYDRNSIYAT